MTIPFDSDASRAVVTMAAQRIASFADRQGIQIEPAQCEELAESLVHVYVAFFAGLQHAAQHNDTASNPRPPVGPS
ncbi:hypothetical protein ACTMTJ_02335 [Phytohabitans sp. LJ34]|uniref:hypothetical protein n=1 Tax=Phytohabitans sp. LJ34 TaxID=3452217 RepID=UPI003F88A8E9